jgi:hypothetical protein
VVQGKPGDLRWHTPAQPRAGVCQDPSFAINVSDGAVSKRQGYPSVQPSRVNRRHSSLERVWAVATHENSP